MIRATLAAVIVLSAAARSAAQSVPRDAPSSTSATGVIRGRVVTADTADPLRNPLVGLSDDAGDTAVLPVLSDAEGRFELALVPPGQHAVAPTKAGYARSHERPARARDGCGPR